MPQISHINIHLTVKITFLLGGRQNMSPRVTKFSITELRR